MKTNRPANKKLRRQLQRWERSSRSEGGGAGSSPESESFQKSVQRREIEHLEMDVRELVEQIHQRGQQLVEHPSLRLIRQYKRLLASFLERSLKLSTKIQRLSGQRNLSDIREGNKEKQHVIVVTIDEKMQELTELVRDKQEDNLDLAGRVGEIRGLVVDLVNTIEGSKP